MRAPRVTWAAAGPAAAPLAAVAVAVAAFAVVGAVDPAEPGPYPRCAALSLIGLYCPGCGGLRSAHAVAHGDLAAAFGANALAAAGFVALGVALLAWLLRPLAGHRARATAWRPPRGAVPAFLLALAGAFTLLRNLPAGAALAP
ncbi:DUF2752 domain-containing protein [Streptomyces sp. 6N223]|uniref:DUF2752 domain-containing protein n=1 Tax=Streptomyces sp. 6N223 TaxID=3457412 RepID=UPI003FCF467B